MSTSTWDTTVSTGLWLHCFNLNHPLQLHASKPLLRIGKDETRVSLDGLEEDGLDATSSTTDALDLSLQSQVATENEHSLSVPRALRVYRPAVFWSLFFCVGQMMTSRPAASRQPLRHASFLATLATSIKDSTSYLLLSRPVF